MTEHSDKETLYSLSQLASLTGLDRATVRKRLEEIEPRGGAKNAKTYQLDEALPAIIAGERTEMDEAKLRKTRAEAELRELEAGQERGDLLRADDVRDYATRLFKALHNRLALRQPRDIAQALYKAETPAQVTEILRRETDRIFNELRADHTTLL